MEQEVSLRVSTQDGVPVRVVVEKPVPLYVTIERAAELAGVARDVMYEWVNARDHIPYMKCGRRRLVRVSAIADYARRFEAQ